MSSFSYFNPKDEKYHLVTTEPVILNAQQGKQQFVENGNTSTSNKIDIIGNENEIRYLHLDSSFVSTEKMK